MAIGFNLRLEPNSVCLSQINDLICVSFRKLDEGLCINEYTREEAGCKVKEKPKDWSQPWCLGTNIIFCQSQCVPVSYTE